MPCYADTIVKIKYVRQSENKNNKNLLIVRAVGMYPIDYEDREVEIVSFVPLNHSERDPESQVVFEKNSFYSIRGKIVPVYYGDAKRPKAIMMIYISSGVGILNSAINLNKCPMKISLVRIPQELLRVIDDESTVFDVLVNDYVGQEVNFVVKIVFDYSNSRLTHFKSTIHLQDSLVFIVGQLEVIANDFYIYAKDINYINTQFLLKSKSSVGSNSYNRSENESAVRSRLIATYHNVQNSKEFSEVKASTSRSSNDFEGDNEFGSLSGDNSSTKHMKVEDVKNLANNSDYEKKN
ncbi:18940_t:CDS:2 [Dentiscutata erythropus]|uniref:18940_t:CDS:1 n=1 Tax=Dentiscutata erythropus TaxID=1348616 RepID=A0A9N9B9U1_9GLOM|nr:18940_t:CDS:2 [Dentiscutata erythropus]